jgi:hemoglobin
MSATMFERYGGLPQIRLIVASFYDKVRKSDVLSPYFANADMPRLIEHQSQFIAQAMGGPTRYTDEALVRVHARLGIDEHAIDVMSVLLADALRDHGVSAEDVGTINGEVGRLARLIVTRAADTPS